MPQSDPLIHIPADPPDRFFLLLSPPTFPPGNSLGMGHHHNSVFSRAHGIQSVVESTSPKSDGTTSFCERDKVEACYKVRELSRNENNDNSPILLFVSRSAIISNPSFFKYIFTYISLISMMFRD